MDILNDLIYQGFVYTLAKLYAQFADFLSGGMMETMGNAIKIIDTTYVKDATQTVQIIALSLLAVKIAIEALQTNILHAYGEPTDAGGFLIRSATAVAAIAAGPWMIRTIYLWGADLAIELTTSGSFSVEDIKPYILSDMYTDTAMAFMVIVGIIALIIWTLILIQTAIRSIELAFLSVAGPIMATGLISSNKGLYAVWWRELLVISLSQATQMFFVKGALNSGGILSFTSKPLELLFFLAWLFVAYKSPGLLKQYAYSSGVGGVMGGAAQTAGTMFIMRKIITRGV